jgi:hypothetical protein
MNSVFSSLSIEQRINAIQRLTALWAFTESGLGGFMHALKIPFTGLVVGGMAVIMICMIADLSEHKYKQILKSALIVLIVKALVSPYTPVTAYLAVSFQALAGFVLFSLLHINFISILLLSTLAMLESAIQKILVLTLFFGTSLWKAMDSMIVWLSTQFGSIVSNGSYWIIGLYLFIYLLGGVFIAWLAGKTLQRFNSENDLMIIDTSKIRSNIILNNAPKKSANKFNKLWLLIFILLIISAVLFVFADNYKDGWLTVIKTISWTLSVILIWFMLIGPLITKVIQKLLKKKESRYRDEVLRTLSFLPVLRQLTVLAWQQSKIYTGFKRWYFFFTALIHTTLIHSESANPEIPDNTKA